jgi:hypothetical protein
VPGIGRLFTFEFSNADSRAIAVRHGENACRKIARLKVSQDMLERMPERVPSFHRQRSSDPLFPSLAV